MTCFRESKDRARTWTPPPPPSSANVVRTWLARAWRALSKDRTSASATQAAS